MQNILDRLEEQREAARAGADLATAGQVIADEPDPVLREVLDRAAFHPH